MSLYESLAGRFGINQVLEGSKEINVKCRVKIELNKKPVSEVEFPKPAFEKSFEASETTLIIYGINEAGSGLSPFAPNWMTANPAWLLCRYQFLSPGRQTAKSAFPSPS